MTTIAKIETSTHYNFLDLLGEAIQCKIEVRNCQPVPAIVSATGSTTVAAGTPFTIRTSASDADGADGPWRLAIDWGAGTSFASTLFVLPTSAAPFPSQDVDHPGITVRVTGKNGYTPVTMQVTVTP